MSNRGLQDIKVGDRVWVSHDNGRIICTVKKLTPKQIVVDWPWGKDGARFYRGAPSRYDKEPHYRKIGYSGWHSSEIQSITTRVECEKYDAEREAGRQRAAADTEARQQRENHCDQLNALFGKRMAHVSESHHIESVEWTVQVNLTTQGVIKLAALLESLTAEELPSWKTD